MTTCRKNFTFSWPLYRRFFWTLPLVTVEKKWQISSMHLIWAIDGDGMSDTSVKGEHDTAKRKQFFGYSGASKLLQGPRHQKKGPHHIIMISRLTDIARNARLMKTKTYTILVNTLWPSPEIGLARGQENVQTRIYQSWLKCGVSS